mmetsp:Transcript_117047/g.364462  ORF Transcript_117047/g.364462 Transcript_117047/m.364462 type:complete len:507 (+) Transcript_117047:61-1581(+)
MQNYILAREGSQECSGGRPGEQARTSDSAVLLRRGRSAVHLHGRRGGVAIAQAVLRQQRPARPRRAVEGRGPARRLGGVASAEPPIGDVVRRAPRLIACPRPGLALHLADEAADLLRGVDVRVVRAELILRADEAHGPAALVATLLRPPVVPAVRRACGWQRRGRACSLERRRGLLGCRTDHLDGARAPDAQVDEAALQEGLGEGRAARVQLGPAELVVLRERGAVGAHLGGAVLVPCGGARAQKRGRASGEEPLTPGDLLSPVPQEVLLGVVGKVAVRGSAVPVHKAGLLPHGDVGRHGGAAAVVPRRPLQSHAHAFGQVDSPLEELPLGVARQGHPGQAVPELRRDHASVPSDGGFAVPEAVDRKPVVLEERSSKGKAVQSPAPGSAIPPLYEHPHALHDPIVAAPEDVRNYVSAQPPVAPVVPVPVPLVPEAAADGAHEVKRDDMGIAPDQTPDLFTQHRGCGGGGRNRCWHWGRQRRWERGWCRRRCQSGHWGGHRSGHWRG